YRPELLGTPVGDEELHSRAVAQTPVSVVAENAGDPVPDLGDLVAWNPRAESGGELRVGGKATAHEQVESGAVFRMDHALKGHIVDLRLHVPGRRTGYRGLVLARQVGKRRITDVAA